MEGTHHETDRSVILSCHPSCTHSAGDLPYAPHPPVCTSIFKRIGQTPFLQPRLTEVLSPQMAHVDIGL